MLLSFRVLVAGIALVFACASGPATAVTVPGAGGADTSRTTAGGPEWPKTIDEFLIGNYLERSDVVLTRRDGDVASVLIRWATESPFSHAALIFTGPQLELGYSNTFVIEANVDGVDLTNLRDYATDKSSFIAVKRLRKPWFDSAKQSRVRGLLLDNIDARYDYSTVFKIAQKIWFGVQNKVEGTTKTVERYRDNNWKPPNDFICSGLVQLGFLEAVAEYVTTKQLPPTALNEVVFSARAAERLPRPEDWQYLGDDIESTVRAYRAALADELQATTPDDLAKSDKLEWLYVIKSGMVHQVASYDDVERLLGVK